MLSNGVMVRLNECAVVKVYKVRKKPNFITFFFYVGGAVKI